MTKEAYAEYMFKEGTRETIAQIDSIVEEYVEQGYRLTVRQIYYQMVARDLFPNDRTWTQLGNGKWVRDPDGTKNAEPNYNWLSGIINDGRMAGLIDWDAIEDRTREFIRAPRWRNPGQIAASAAAQFSMDLWEPQEHRVFVIIEKEALVGVLEDTCRRYDLPLLAARGYPSGSVLREFALTDLQPALFDEGKQIVVLHLGDHDPSGIDMTRDLQERLTLFTGRRIRLKRIALNMDQVEEQKPPPNPAKTTDSRFRSYMDQYGDESWELDALQPAYMNDLVREAVEEFIDPIPWQQRKDEVKEARHKLLEAAKALGATKKEIDDATPE